MKRGEARKQSVPSLFYAVIKPPTISLLITCNHGLSCRWSL